MHLYERLTAEQKPRVLREMAEYCVLQDNLRPAWAGLDNDGLVITTETPGGTFLMVCDTSTRTAGGTRDEVDT
jgi:hypothetical protein